MPLLEGPIIPQNGGAAKPPLQFTLYLPLLGGAYFGQIFCFKYPSKNQTNEILVQNYSRCLISISLLYPRRYHHDRVTTPVLTRYHSRANASPPLTRYHSRTNALPPLTRYQLSMMRHHH